MHSMTVAANKDRHVMRAHSGTRPRHPMHAHVDSELAHSNELLWICFGMRH